MESAFLKNHKRKSINSFGSPTKRANHHLGWEK